MTFGSKKSTNGFALPAVLLSGVILMAMLVISSSAASSVVSVTKTQYYEQLAREAAESGVTMASDCVVQDEDSMVRWSPPLTTGSGCEGTDTCSGANCYVAYVDGGKTRSSFSVTANLNSEGRPISFTSKGTVELYRSSANTVWKSHDVVVRAAAVRDPANVIDFSSGTGGYSCVVSNQRAYCYGVNYYGQVGRGNTTGPVAKPVPVKSTSMNGPIVSIATGSQHSCTVMATQADGRGDVYCWGRNNHGQLGTGNNTTYDEPVRVNDANLNGQSISVVAGNNHTCALTGTPGNADAYCWGDNSLGQVGVNSGTSSYRTPRAVSMLGSYGFSSLSAGPTNDHMCGVASVGGLSPRAFCWGNNSYGQVGNNSTNSVFRSPQAVGGALAANVRSVVVGGDDLGTGRGFSCAVLDATSTGYCWGADYLGWLGIHLSGSNDNTVLAVRTPTKLRSGGSPTQNTDGVIDKIVLGSSFGCALRDSFASRAQKTVMCWGNNSAGQLAMDDMDTNPNGDSDGPSSLCSVRYPPTTSGESANISVRGKYRKCMSQPFEMFATKPGEPDGLYEDGVTDVIASGGRGCIIAGGTFYCWGRNTEGQAGVADTTPAYIRWPTRADLVENLRGYRFF